MLPLSWSSAAAKLCVISGVTSDPGAAQLGQLLALNADASGQLLGSAAIVLVHVTDASCELVELRRGTIEKGVMSAHGHLPVAAWTLSPWRFERPCGRVVGRSPFSTGPKKP